jgi:hypothetical protein
MDTKSSTNLRKRRPVRQLPFISVLVLLVLFSSAIAQQPKIPAAARVPPQIATAQKIFVSNAGGETFENTIDAMVFNGGPDRPFNEFYAALKDWAIMNLSLRRPTRILYSK